MCVCLIWLRYHTVRQTVDESADDRSFGSEWLMKKKKKRLLKIQPIHFQITISSIPSSFITLQSFSQSLTVQSLLYPQYPYLSRFDSNLTTIHTQLCDKHPI